MKSCSLLLLLLIGSIALHGQVSPYLPFGSFTSGVLRNAIPLGDLLDPASITVERKLELNTQFQEITDSISNDPKNGFYYFQRAMLRLELGGLRGALEDFERARSLGYRKRETYFHLGIVNAALGERGSAIAYLNICLKKDSTDVEVLYYEGVTKLYLKHGSAEERCVEAIPEFTKALHYNGSLRDAFILRGCAYDRLGQHDLAIADFNSALAMSPGNPNIMLLIGQATLKSHQPPVENTSPSPEREK